MEQDLEQIRDQQQQSWDKSSESWGKWDVFMMDYMKPLGDAMINALDLKTTDIVLDIAAGTGEPGLTIAGLVPEGRVVITDLSDRMLDVARANAKSRGVANIETKACDASELPFDTATFDKVSCRLGLMYFPDLLLGTKEMARVLKPGGVLTACVWGPPPLNGWVGSIMSVINKHMQLPPPPPNAPGMFRCSAPGLVTDLFTEAGLHDVKLEEVSGLIHFGSIENYWIFMREVAPPVIGAMAKADEAMKAAMYADLESLLNSREGDHKASLPFSATVVTGTR